MALAAALVALLAAAAGAAPVALAAAGATTVDPVRTIRFARGTSRTVIEGAVPRGERMLYAFNARAGQRLTVAGAAQERNIAFQIWRPGYRLGPAAGGDIGGRTLAGAGPADDASHWRGRLPTSGRYLLVAGATRGGASYRLDVAIR